MCRSDLFRSRTFRASPARDGLIWRRRSVTSLCIVLLLTPNATAVCLTVALFSIIQKLHEIEEKEHGKILLAGQWILESEIAGLREKAGKLGEEKKVSWEKLNEIFLKEV